MKTAHFIVFLAVVFALVFAADGKQNKKSKTAKENKTDKDNSKASTSTDEKDSNDEEKQTFKDTSLPVVAVAETSLPAATKASDKGVSQAGDAPDRVDDDSESGSGQTDENANKPINVKSKNVYENDSRKFAESVKKSTQGKISKPKEENNGKDAKKTKTDKQSSSANNKDASKKSKVGKKEPSVSTEKDKKVKQSSSSKKDSQKRGSSGHHHHHHHHHSHSHDKKTKRPLLDNEANKPKKDYPVFDWKKQEKCIKDLAARIPGWNGAPQEGMAQLLALCQVSPSGLPRDIITWPAEKLMNGTIANQGDIASIDKESTETTEQSSQKNQSTGGSSDNQSSQQDKNVGEKATVSPSDKSAGSDSSASDADSKNPVAQTVESDTGEVPHSISKTADVKVPDNIPARCAGLVKSYSNAELTLMDYLKQLKKCKRADADFNQAHPGHGDVMLRSSISKNGALLTKEAYKYALQRMRNYVPSTKERQQAEQILAKWRSNSFGTREAAAANGEIPDAVKSFMTGQNNEGEARSVKRQSIQAQTEKAIDQANQFILGTITGRTGDLPASSDNVKRFDIATAGTTGQQSSLVANPNQSIAKVIAAAQALITGDKNGQALVLTPGGSTAVIPLAPSVSKKQAIPAPSFAEKKAKAIQMAKVAEKLNSALLSQISPEPETKSDKTSTSLLAALKKMASAGPETQTSSISVKASVQKRSILDNQRSKSKRKRRGLSVISMHKNKRSHHTRKHMRKRRAIEGIRTENDNPSERSKMNKPIVPAPKLMDKIRDMSMVIATP